MNIIKKGTIDFGDYCGWHILIEDDRNGETGGYYIYLQQDNGQGFDFWHETETELQNQLAILSINWTTDN